jgi:DNA-binding response OmpR family regulator
MNKKKILIVDDEMDMRSVLEKALTVEGYSIVTACNGNDGLVAIRSELPDLIILDRALGDMLGEEVAVRLKNDPKTKDIPIIYLSALFSKTDELEKGNSFNGNSMYSKPFEISELLTTIKELL